MRLHIRRLLTCQSWPCQVILLMTIVLLVFQISHLFMLLYQTTSPSNLCRCLKGVQTEVEKYPVYRQQNQPTLNDKPLNWIDFYFAVQPQSMCLKNTSVAVVVHSKTENFARRSLFRNSYLKSKALSRKPIQAVFVVADNATYRQQLEVEARTFGDLLVVGGINEHYHNITHKTRAWIRWLNDRCPHTQVVFKCDDDVQLNVNGLMSLLDLFDKHRSLVLCRVYHSGQVVRNSRSKWFLTKNEYNATSLGRYCQGMAYLFSGNLLPKMLSNIKKVQYLWMDDWYTTHALLNATDALYTDIGRHFLSTSNRSELARLLYNSTLQHEPVFGHFRPFKSLTASARVWSRLQSRPCCNERPEPKSL